MRSRRFWLVLAGLAGASALAAQDPPPPQNPQSPRPMRQRVHQPEFPGFVFGIYAPDHLVDRREALDLTPEQVSQLATLAQEARAARERSDTAARSHEEQLRTLWEADAPDVRVIETHMQAVHAVRQAEHLAAMRAAARAKAVLTPEQRGRVDGWRDGARAMVRRGVGPRSDRPARMGRDGRPGWPGMGLRRR